jgi:hypothetical protein
MHDSEWWTMGPGTVRLTRRGVTEIARRVLADTDGCPECGAAVPEDADRGEWQAEHAQSCEALRDRVTP